MSISSTYLLNVALHGAVLSIFATGLLVLLRRPGQRSFVAISGLLAVGVLPWMTALRPERRVSEPVAQIQAQPASPTLPLWTIVTLPMPEEKSVVDHSEPVATPPRPFVFPDALTCVALIWAAGTATGLILLAGALLKACLWKRSLRPLDETACQTFASLSPDIPRRHLFLLSESTTSPCVTGFVRPRIVLPVFLLEKDAEQQLRWAVGHELAHLRAGDSRWIILFSLVRCVNWWNPFVHILVSRWAEAREQLCDLHATGLSEDRLDYGKFLIAMARRITGRPPLAVTMAKRAHANRLKQRITSLLESRADSMKPLGKGFISIGSALAITAAVSVSALRIGAEEVKDLPKVVADTAPEKAPEKQKAPEPPAKPADAAPLPAKPSSPRSVVRWTAGPQLKFNVKLLTTPATPPLKEGTLLSEENYQLHMRSMNQKKGVYLMTAPSISSRSGESVEVQIIRHVPVREGQKTPKDTAPFVGISLTMTGKVTGNTVDLKFDADYRFVPGRDNTQLAREEAAKINPDDIRIVKHSTTSRMGPGQTLVSYPGEIEPGRFLHILVTAIPVNSDGEALDAFVDGKPVDPQAGTADTKSTPGKQEARPFRISPRAESGKLRLNAVVIDLPRDPSLPANERNFRKLSPAADDSLNALIKHHRLEKRQLKQVEIPLNGPHVPWPEFPGIRLSAVAAEDMAAFALTNDSEENGTSSVSPMSPGDMVHIDVQSGNPAIERRVYITAVPVK